MTKLPSQNYPNMELTIKYYKLKYGNDMDHAFIHLIRELGQIAYTLETNNEAVFNAKETEAIALLNFLARKLNINIESNIETMTRKNWLISITQILKIIEPASGFGFHRQANSLA
jgi:hypothetical protein